MSLFTLDAAAWAIKAPVLVATVSAIFVSPNHNRFHRRFGAQRQGNARVCIKYFPRSGLRTVRLSYCLVGKEQKSAVFCKREKFFIDIAPLGLKRHGF
jgi:hypothetical protein